MDNSLLFFKCLKNKCKENLEKYLRLLLKFTFMLLSLHALSIWFNLKKYYFFFLNKTYFSIVFESIIGKNWGCKTYYDLIKTRKAKLNSSVCYFILFIDLFSFIYYCSLTELRAWNLLDFYKIMLFLLYKPHLIKNSSWMLNFKISIDSKIFWKNIKWYFTKTLPVNWYLRILSKANTCFCFL